MIVSVSRRTDIPCCYADWFMARIRAGYVLTRNPMNHAQLSRIPLTPDVADCIVFWTKDAYNIMPHLHELDGLGYRYYFQFTLTPYDRTIETNLRPKEDIERTFAMLSQRIGRDRVLWRYDPVLLCDSIDVAWHKAQFVRMCNALAAHTDTVTISFLDRYAKMRASALRAPDEAEQHELAAFFARTAYAHGLRIAACCEAQELAQYSIERASCIDRARVEHIIGQPLRAGADKHQRTGCGCCESVDIGAYHTCVNGCTYCYATASREAAYIRYAAHSPHDELLCGSVAPGEKVTERAYTSSVQTQLTLC